MNDKIADEDDKDGLFEKFGCLIYTVAPVLFAIQRYFLFSYILYISIYNSTAVSILGFLFGEFPYSILDVLLGIEIPDEGLILLLQPRYWALGLVQAIHIGLNIGLVALPLWLKSKIDKTSGFSKGFGYLSLVGLIIIPIIIFVKLGSFSNKSEAISSDTQSAGEKIQSTHYSNTEYGIHFDLPSFLTTEDDLMKDRGPSGEIVTLVNISATSTDPFVGIIISSIEDPLRNEMFPNLYPPNKTTFQILVVGDIGEMEFDDTEENKLAIETASENVKITTISGHDAAVYNVGLSTSEFGHLYIRGALIITEVRDISLYVIGSDELNVRGSVDPDFIDSLWKEMINSLKIDF